MRFQIVSFHCVLKNKLGRVMSRSFNQGVLPQSSSVSELEALVETVKKLKPGETGKVQIRASEAYGYYRPELQIVLPRKALKNGPNLKVGDTVFGKLGQSDSTETFRVIEADSLEVVLDANHPLAGQDLYFDVELVSSQTVEEGSFQHIQELKGPDVTKWWQ